MDDWISVLPSIVLAQALGVGVTWGVDALSWKWRDSDAVAGLINIFGLFSALFLFSSLSDMAAAMAGIAWVLGLSAAWLFVVTSVQKRQLKAPFRATFFGALMQLICFVWAVVLYFAIVIFRDGMAPWGYLLIWFATATLTYVLLSLFRPTIYGAWNTWRQNSGKNRPMR